MKLYTLLLGGREVLAAEGAGGRLLLLEKLGIGAKDMNDLIDRWETLEKPLREALAATDPEAEAPAEAKILAPIPRPKQDVICLGVNYRSHIEETKDGIDFTKQQATVYFSKRVTRCNDPEGSIPAYDFVDSGDYEAELGVILGKAAFRVSPEEAKACVFGYTVINDVSARNVQKTHAQWYFGKSLDGYTPMGPCIVTADEIPDPHSLRITCTVNGELRQDSNTGLMITTPEEAISELSAGMTLIPGTVIATGTPGGVGMGMKPPVWLKAGDVITCAVEGIGELTNPYGV